MISSNDFRAAVRNFRGKIRVRICEFFGIVRFPFSYGSVLLRFLSVARPVLVPVRFTCFALLLRP